MINDEHVNTLQEVLESIGYEYDAEGRLISIQYEDTGSGVIHFRCGQARP